MSSDKQIDHPPTNTPFFNQEGHIHIDWQQWIDDIKPTLESTISNNRIHVPNVGTTADRDSIPDTENGHLVYNQETNQFNVYENGGWKVMNTT